MTIPYTYFYNEQTKKYIGQFLRIFAGLQVRDGVDRDSSGQNDTRNIPVHYGNVERITASIINKRQSFTSTTVPIISGYLRSMRRKEENQRPKHHVDRIAYIKQSDSTRSVTYRLMPVPMEFSMELSIYASSTNQMFEILEQILLLFNPEMTFQKGTDINDFTYITSARLESISNNENYPIGSEKRILIQTLTFTFDAYYNYPYTENDNIIEQIIANIKDDTNEVVDLDSITIDENTPTG